MPFDSGRTHRAIEKVFKAEMDLDDGKLVDEVTRARVAEITEAVVGEARHRATIGQGIHVESIQDAVERHIMKEKNLFETRVTEYQTAASLEW